MTPVSSYDELMAAQAQAAVAISDAHHSSWNKEVHPLPASQDKSKANIRAYARWDGAIEYRGDVTQTLQDMFAKAGRASSDADLEQYRDALGVVLHENVHLLAGRGTSHGMAFDAYQEPAVATLDEGVTEAYKRIALDAYIDELGLEQIAPGLKSVRADRSYPQFVPAAEVLASAIGRRADLPGDEVMRRMAVVNAEDKFRVAAELVYASSDLPDLVPEGHQAAVVTQIAATLKGPFEQISDLDPDDHLDLRMSPLAGAEADQAAAQYVRQQTTFWRDRQDLRKTLDVGLGQTSPREATGSDRASGDTPRRGGHLSRQDQTSCRPIDRD
ncbi:hypothetical protein FB561_1619 [Kribbella amoyensis]|uniref:Uncharacterized protein n=1 Tax=Kribbella amoyensis TaxID=996641 RepID=A0A561BNT8_9ACTN|nr:hypothetical protein [Kribbella amoyensis]TWD80538.1 hypothetical protein FB561_1619 [Kribbella amoyensis]